MDIDDVFLVLGVLVTGLAIGALAGTWWGVLFAGLSCLAAGLWSALT